MFFNLVLSAASPSSTVVKAAPFLCVLAIGVFATAMNLRATAEEPSELTFIPAEELTAPLEPVPVDNWPADLSLDAPIQAHSIDDTHEGRPILGLVEPPAVAVEEEGVVDPFLGYNTTASETTWLPGDDDEFGWVSLESLASLRLGSPGGLVAGMGFHFLDGPVQTEMPPRLFDFTIGYQRREWIRPNIGWDFVFRVGAFSDFEGSAKDSIRFPSHLVTFWRIGPTATWLLGVDYLDWDDLNLLPVFGAVWMPTDDFRIDAVFPRPRVSLRIMDSCTWLYIGGEIDGGTWAIERNDSWNDNATYHDLRLVFGIETWADNCMGSALELGYVFDRELSYRSGLGNYSPQDCLMVRMVGKY